MRKSLTLLLVIVMVFSGGLMANGLSLNSIGTKALGMGGAFVGVANDLTAIYWNPAGLTQVKGTNVALFVTDIIPMGTYKFNYPAFGLDIDAKMKTNHYVAPNLFANYSMDKWSFGLGIYVPAGLGAEWDMKDFPYAQNLELMSKIAVVNISPTVAYQVSDQFSIGVAVNIYYAMFDMKRPVQDMTGTYVQYDEESTGTAFGAAIGLKYDINKQFSIGANFRMSTTVTMEGTAKNPAFAAAGAPESDFERDVTWPMWIGGGIAYKPMCCLTLALDAQYSKWSELDELETTYKNSVWAAMIPPESANLELKWKDATQIRFGAEYMAKENLPLRLGYYYDPAPSPDETLNILFPSSTNHVLTGGFGFLAEKWKFDFALEYLFGAEREIEAVLVDPANPGLGFTHEFPGKHKMDIFAFSIGATYSF